MALSRTSIVRRLAQLGRGSGIVSFPLHVLEARPRGFEAGLIPGVELPATHDAVAVEGIELAEIATTADLVGGDECGA
jgi:hypothetical protein